jgi:hypothetical protein
VFSGELSFEEAMDLSQDRLRLDLGNVKVSLRFYINIVLL